MKKFFIESFHTVYEDSYEKGELSMCNNWKQSKIINAKDAIEAIKKYYETELFKTFVLDNVEMDEENLFDSFLVDADYCEATETEKQSWKNNELRLYSENITINVSILSPVKFN